MNARAVFAALLVGVSLAGSSAWGQDFLPPPQGLSPQGQSPQGLSAPRQPTLVAPTDLPPPGESASPLVWDAPRNSAGMIATNPGPGAAGANPGLRPGAPPSGGPSDWILYRKCDSCFGPLSAEPHPIHMELLFRGGPSFAIGGTKLGRDLQTGFNVTFGGRALFFDPNLTRANTVEVHVVNINNSAAGQQPANISVFQPSGPNGTAQRVNFGEGGVPPVTIHRYNRTLVGLGFGREYYLNGSAIDPGTRWRVGYDVGGRYGSAKIDLNEIRHRTDVVGALYAAIHTDLEIPCGPCWFVMGARCEYDHTWSDILQRATDVQDIAALVNLGVRY